MNDNRPAGGPWTGHGHSIPGITVVGSGRPPVYRCGGVALCKKCKADAEAIAIALSAPSGDEQGEQAHGVGTAAQGSSAGDEGGRA